MAEETNKGGRPTKCTPELTAKFAEYMSAGMYLEDAAGLCHIGRRTAYQWFEIGEEAITEAGGDLEGVPEEKLPYATFTHTVRAAEARALAGNLALIQQGARDRQKPVDADGNPLLPGDWRAAEAFLKMRKPDTYGMRKQQSEVSGPGGAPVQVEWWQVVSETQGGDDEPEETEE